MGLEAVAELVRRAARDTTAMRALADAPDRLASLLDLTPGELQALRATTSIAGPESRSLGPAPPSESGTGLLPPQGSGVPAATPIAGITGLPGGPPPPPAGPPQPPLGPPPPPPAPPVQPPPPTGPTPPQVPTTSPPPAPATPPPLGGEGPAPASTAPAGPIQPDTCRSEEAALVATVAIVANTAITAITAIAAMPCGRPCDGHPTSQQPCQGGK